MYACPSCSFANAPGAHFCGRCRLYLLPVGEYILQRLVGKGGFASVYYAEHRHTKRPAAVKLLHSEWLDRTDIQQRFQREAHLMLSFNHPHIVKLYEFGILNSPDLGAYMTMEWCEGKTLQQSKQARAKGRFSPQEARILGIQLLDGLSHIHSKGIVHRDVKPGNLMLVRTPIGLQLKILDFGVAWIEGETLTRSGMVVGSLMYMAPEQIRGKKEQYGPATDLYAVGLVLAWMLTGSHVFGEGSGEEIATHHVMKTPPSLSSLCPEVRWSPSLEAVVAKALQKDPKSRFRSADAFLKALQQAEFPDFAYEPTLPSEEAIAMPLAFASHPLSAYDDTGMIPHEMHKATEPSSAPKSMQTYGGELFGSGIHGADTVHSNSMMGTFPEEPYEGASRRRRRRGSGGIWGLLLLLVCSGAGAYWWFDPLGIWHPDGGSAFSRSLPPRVPATPERPTTPDNATSGPIPEEIRVAPDGKEAIPAWILRILEQWRQAWEQLARKPFSQHSADQFAMFYAPEFQDVEGKRNKDAEISFRSEQARQSSWMRISFQDFRLQAITPNQVIIQFHQRCYGSTLKAADSELSGSTYKEEGIKVVQLQRTEHQWFIQRIHWFVAPTSAPAQRP